MAVRSYGMVSIVEQTRIKELKQKPVGQWVAVVFFLILGLAAHAQDVSEETMSFLVFVVHEEESIENAYVTVSKGAGESETYLLRERDYQIELQINGFYFLRFDCDGYQSKEVKVNTYVLGENDASYAGFDIELLPTDSAQLAVDVPVALIRYDRQEKTLIPDRGYDQYVRAKRQQMKDGL